MAKRKKRCKEIIVAGMRINNKTSLEVEVLITNLGIQEMIHEDFVDLLYETEDGDASDNLYDSYDDACRTDDDYAITVRLSKIKGYWVVWRSSYFDPEEISVYDSEETARKDIAVIIQGYYPPIDIWKKEILEGLEKIGLNSNNVWLKPVYGGFRIYYQGSMILEHIKYPSIDMIREAVEGYQNFDQTLKESGYELKKIWKMPREWNNNQRYYCVEVTDEKGIDYSEEIHIPSRSQGQPRCVVDYIDVAALMEKCNTYRKKREKELKNYVAPDYSKATPLTAKELDSLKKDLATVLSSLGSCDGTLKYTKKWLEKNKKPDTCLLWLEKTGGFCDCEVVDNCRAEED